MLAEYVLRGQTPWDRQTISDAMTGDRTIRVPVARPPSVFVLYATAVADTGGVINFYPDLYGHDAALVRALGLGPVESRPAVSPVAGAPR
jgi:murein L,D-transpeptidase YcbB/YkuD